MGVIGIGQRTMADWDVRLSEGPFPDRGLVGNIKRLELQTKEHQ